MAERFTLTDQRILMDVRINGRGPYSFVVDSGANVSLIRPERARELGLQPSTTMQTDNSRTLPADIVRELIIGTAVRQANVKLVELDTPNLGADGILAGGLLTGTNCELDFDQHQWRVHSNGTTPGPDFLPVPVQFRSAAPDVSRQMFSRITLDGLTLEPILDTGSPRPIILSYELGQRLGFLEPGVPYSPIFTGGGVDPSHYVARLVRAKTLQIGPFDYSRNLVAVRPKGAYGQPAIVGLPILRTLNLWIDGPSGKLWAKRSALSPSGSSYSYSGLWIASQGSRITVIDVGTGSPGERAGVRVGDDLVGLDISKAKAIAAANPGTAVTLNLQRNGSAVQVQFSTESYL